MRTLIKYRCLLLGIIFIIGNFGTSYSLGGQRNRYKVRAWIGPRCQTHPGKFKVPPGKYAVSLRFGSFTAGTGCKSGRTIKDRAFSIFKWVGNEWQRVFRVVHRYGQSPVHYPIHINDTKLASGTYLVRVAGGNGAQVILSYLLGI